MHIVAALYKFAPLPDAPERIAPLRAACETAGIKGTLLLAPEGINGTIAGPRDGVDAAIAAIRALPGFAGLEWKESRAATPPFARLKVRLKKEIVTLGRPEADPTKRVGEYIEPADWNAVVSAPDVAVIDTRNDYEVGIGRFEGAVDPGTAAFSDFPAWWAKNQDAFEGKRIAMYCTGGIRCEKASSWLLSEGVEEVLHLKGGILRYLEATPEAESLWRGECFVFDERVAVGHGLKQGEHGLCRACGAPVSAGDRNGLDFEDGVACPACKDRYSVKDRERFRERQRQITLARARGGAHLGPK